MESKKRIKLYNDTIYQKGTDHQVNIAIEECSELIGALSKERRLDRKENYVDVLTEMADVSIMIEQLKLIFNISNKMLKTEIDYKLNRLKKRLENNALG